MAYQHDVVPASPNSTPGRPLKNIEFLTIHHWGDAPLYQGQDDHGVVVNYLCTPRNPGSSASAVISGWPVKRVTEIGGPTMIAWHAGNWDANLASRGYELLPFDRNTPAFKVHDTFETAAEYIALEWHRYPWLKDRDLRWHNEFKATRCPGGWEALTGDLLARVKDYYPLVDPARPGFLLTPPPPLPKEMFMQNPVVGYIPRGGLFGADRGGFPHAGLDITCPVGTPVYAAFGGEVKWVETGRTPGDKTASPNAPGRTGNKVMVANVGPASSNDGEGQTYGHLSRIVVSTGDTVREGQLIAYSGNTGNTTGPHLHLETWKNWRDHRSTYDPMRAFDAAKVIPGSAVPSVAVMDHPDYLPLRTDGLDAARPSRTWVELQRVLKALGLYTGNIDGDPDGPLKLSWKAYQRFLKAVGEYTGYIDGDFGEMSVKAEQRWLRKGGYYPAPFGIDGVRGMETVRAVQKALNAKAFVVPAVEPTPPAPPPPAPKPTPPPVKPTPLPTPAPAPVPIPTPAPGVDLDALADAVVRNILNRISEK